MTRPLVSVVMPAFDPGAYLAQAIESLLAQTYQPLEIVVVDDGSTPPCAPSCQAYPGVRYTAQAHQGPGAARNAGVRLSRGDFIAFQDADDLSLPQRIAVEMAALERGPDLGLVLSRLENFRAPDFDVPAWFRGEAEMRDRLGFIGTALVRREVFTCVGGFDEAYLIGEDIDWLIRAREAGVRHGECAEVLVRRRIHAGNTSADIQLGHRNLARILHASLRRRQRGTS